MIFQILNTTFTFYIRYFTFYISLARIVLPRRSEYVESTKLTATSLFLIFTFLLFISLATKALRHKEPRRLFLYFRNENFPLWGTEGAHEFKNCLHEKMMISFEKYHFYILHWIFYILHFLRHKGAKTQRTTKAFSCPD